jgi:2-oxoglutarate ferredoxin oxidoreductase subunit beta
VTFVARADRRRRQASASTSSSARPSTRAPSFVEVYQNCQVYNNNAYSFATDRKTKHEHVVYLEHGKPLIYGNNRDKGVRFNGREPEVVDLKKVSQDDLIIHDENVEDPALAASLARMHFPDFPVPLGVFRAVGKPVYETLVSEQVSEAIEKRGRGSLEALLNEGDVWEVK